MKKILMLTLAAAGVLVANAQDCKSLFDQAEALDKAFNKTKPTVMNPKNEITAEAAEGLIQAMELYDQVMECEKTPNAKGKVEDKLTKKAMKSILVHATESDFNKAAVVLFNANKRYPEAYKAFILSGESSKEMKLVPDSIYAIDFYNAGNCAYGTNFSDAAEAYTQARAAGSKDPNVYVYNIASIQQIALQDSTFAKTASAQVYEIAKEGVDRFGVANDYVYGNYLQKYLDDSDFAGAKAVLDKDIKANPENANLYRLRAIVHNANKEYKESIPDFEKVAELSDNYEYVRDAASNINSIGKHLMGQLPVQATPDQKAEMKDIFTKALNIASKAQGLENANQSNISGIIEDIEYNLGNANKL